MSQLHRYWWLCFRVRHYYSIWRSTTAHIIQWAILLGAELTLNTIHYDRTACCVRHVAWLVHWDNDDVCCAVESLHLLSSCRTWQRSTFQMWKIWNYSCSLLGLAQCNCIGRPYVNIEDRVQLHLSSKRPNGGRYTNAMKHLAVLLFYKGRRAYSFLSKMFCVPSRTTLTLWMNSVTVLPAFNDDVFSDLEVPDCSGLQTPAQSTPRQSAVVHTSSSRCHQLP